MAALTILNPESLNEIETQLRYAKDRDFFHRVWSKHQSVYQDRLKALGFENLDQILDAGCGYGQWSLALAALNRSVIGIDIDEERVETAKKVAKLAEVTNISFKSGSVENPLLKAESLDAIFSYGVIFLTDFRKTLRCFHRLLKPQGKLYFSANGLGWYLYNLIDEHKPSEDFSPRQMAIDALGNSIRYYATGEHEFGKSLVIGMDVVEEESVKAGFSILAKGPEGTINLKPGLTIHPFYPDAEKYGHDNIYELLCQKPY